MSIYKKLISALISVVCLLATSLAVQANKLPDNVFKKYVISDKSTPALHQLVKEAAQSTHSSPRKARKLITKVFDRLVKGDTINKYDYLWTQYGLLKSSYETNTGTFGPGNKSDYIKIAHNVLAYLDTQKIGNFQYTELGGFQMEVYRAAGNGLAWQLMSDPKAEAATLTKALNLVIKTEPYMRGKQDYFIMDTKVRILLKLNRKREAFKIVRTILTRSPSFKDFQDFKINKEYRRWKKNTN